ncbi:hypothetical protein [Nocardia sp. GTS18]|uniref:hypothetical protein n=1 Tax=Nocardia sp. GTS18 TaxID=1778064 RepID=UPI0015EE63CA|nr:hypothetical protein [Nocardia sp. GTS18]
MLVLTLVLAAIGFALLVAALATGSVAWAWACILICIVGAGTLLVSALAGGRPENDPVQPGRHARKD